jgi:hypothetical protein
MSNNISKNSLYIKAAMEISNNLTKDIKPYENISRVEQNNSRVGHNIRKTDSKRTSHYRVKT